MLIGVLLITGFNESSPADPQGYDRRKRPRARPAASCRPTVSNGDDEAVAAAVLQASASVGGELGVADLEIDFLPAGTELEVAFGFSAQPTGEVTVRLVGFRQP
ncbi:MAG TPA: hypothetical protein VK992_00705 [Candidatus Caenarcaniphilales bacterium]|nr:hypothetical protein [Candidatus Caenarcaniphilales bacterium]